MGGERGEESTPIDGAGEGLPRPQRTSDKTPFIADLKPSGRYVMEDLHKVGGTPAVLKYLLSKGMIDGSW